MDELEITNEPAVVEAPETKQPVTEPATAEKQPEQTVGEILNTEPDKKPNLIPEAAFLSEKTGRKEAEKQVKELKAQIAAGATREEVSDDIDALLDQYGLDDTNKQFFNRLAKSLETRAERKAKEDLDAKLAPIQQKERSDQINQAFTKHYNDAIEQFPELKGVANPDAVKALSLDPRNANKTFTQLIEEIYGGIPQGKRSIETVQPGGTKEPQNIDFARAAKDTKYFDQIMADPNLKKEYNKDLQRRNKL